MQAAHYGWMWMQIEETAFEEFAETVTRVAGKGTLATIQEKLGGTLLYIPSEIESEDHPLAQAIGVDCADLLCRELRIVTGNGEYLGLRVPIRMGVGSPMRQRASNVDRLITTTSLTLKEIALRLKCSERNVVRRAKALRDQGKTPHRPYGRRPTERSPEKAGA